MKNLTIRTDVSEEKKFRARCKRIGKKPGDVLREFMEAFNEERVTITPVHQPYHEGEK
jgi:hypothetical protein